MISTVSLQLHAIMPLMLTLMTAQGFGLGDEIPSVLGIVIGPAVHFRYLAGPVAMPGSDGRRPFQRRGFPGFLGSHFPSFKDGIEEIEDEHQLYGEDHHRHRGDETVQIPELVEG